MLKDRLIFSLLFGDGFYHLSRNFNLQRVGDIHWVQEHYCLDILAHHVDELIVLDVSRQGKSIGALAEQVEALGHSVFIPLAAGGGIRKEEDAHRLFQAGVDKLVLNSAFFLDPGLTERLAAVFGSQSIVASLDYRIEDCGMRRVHIMNGVEKTTMDLTSAVRHVESHGAGEVYVTCIDRDGTGEGYDLEGLRICTQATSLPVIASGGAGNSSHFSTAFRDVGLQAVSTANLFNFMDEGLKDARQELLDIGHDLARWVPYAADGGAEPGSGSCR